MGRAHRRPLVRAPAAHPVRADQGRGSRGAGISVDRRDDDTAAGRARLRGSATRIRTIPRPTPRGAARTPTRTTIRPSPRATSRSGAEDLESDDEARGRDGARTLAEDLAAVRIVVAVAVGGDARGDGRGAAATSSTGIDREAQAARGAAAFEDDEIQEAFAAFDEDGDGLLDVNDVQSFFDALGESLTLYEVAELIKMVDGDGDGMVNFDEFFDLATRSARFFEQGG